MYIGTPSAPGSDPTSSGPSLPIDDPSLSGPSLPTDDPSSSGPSHPTVDATSPLTGYPTAFAAMNNIGQSRTTPRRLGSQPFVGREKKFNFFIISADIVSAVSRRTDQRLFAGI